MPPHRRHSTCRSTCRSTCHSTCRSRCQWRAALSSRPDLPAHHGSGRAVAAAASPALSARRALPPCRQVSLGTRALPTAAACCCCRLLPLAACRRRRSHRKFALTAATTRAQRDRHPRVPASHRRGWPDAVRAVRPARGGNASHCRPDCHFADTPLSVPVEMPTGGRGGCAAK